MALRNQKKRIGDMLIDEHVITEEQLSMALPVAKENKKKIGETLIEMGFTTENEIAKALSAQLGIPRIDLSSIIIPEDVLGLVNESVLRKHIMIPFAYDDANPNMLHVAM